MPDSDQRKFKVFDGEYSMEFRDYLKKKFVINKFTDFDKLQKDICLFDLLTLDIVLKNGLNYKLILSVEITEVKLEEENKGNLMIWFEKSGKRVPLKTNLIHPGNEKVQYYLIAEIKNEKIDDLVNKLD